MHGSALNNSSLPDRVSRPVLVLIGPTAIGKTELSLKLSEAFNCEIISVDSMQVYRYMDIGTAKIPPGERRSVPHHLIDIINPDENYDAVRFADDCLKAIKNIHQRSSIPLLTGGTGLYLHALKYGFFDSPPINPDVRSGLRARLNHEGVNKLHEELSLHDRISADKIHKNDTYRIVRALEVFYSSGVPLSAHQLKTTAPAARFSRMLTIGLTSERPALYRRINTRTQAMIEGGFEEEVRSLLQRGYSAELKSMQSIGYRHMHNYIAGLWSMDQMIAELSRDTRRYAKRQYTWFNKDESITWFNRNDKNLVLPFVDNWLLKQ